MGKNLPAMQEMGVWIPGSKRFPEEGNGNPPLQSVFLPGEFHGQRSLVGCSSWGRKKSDTTERLTLSL